MSFTDFEPQPEEDRLSTLIGIVDESSDHLHELSRRFLARPRSRTLAALTQSCVNHVDAVRQSIEEILASDDSVKARVTMVNGLMIQAMETRANFFNGLLGVSDFGPGEFAFIIVDPTTNGPRDLDEIPEDEDIEHQPEILDKLTEAYARHLGSELGRIQAAAESTSTGKVYALSRKLGELSSGSLTTATVAAVGAFAGTAAANYLFRKSRS